MSDKKINATEYTPPVILRFALMRAEEQDWQSVLVLGVSRDGLVKHTASYGMSHAEAYGLGHYLMQWADRMVRQTVEDDNA